MPKPQLTIADVNRTTVAYYANLFGVERNERESDRHFGYRVASFMLQEHVKQSEAFVQALHRRRSDSR